MKFRLLAAIAAVLILAICGGLWFLRVQAVKENPWHFVNSEISLGTMTRDQAKPVTFEIKNETGMPIKIASAEGSCRCTSLQSAPDEIPAHGIGSFTFLFSAARFQGPVTHTVTVEAEDGRTIDGTFSAFVKEPTSVSNPPKAD
jgi:hypothetical protein